MGPDRHATCRHGDRRGSAAAAITGTHREQTAVLHSAVCASNGGPLPEQDRPRLTGISEPEPETSPVPAFIPVPRQYEYFRGWSPERQRLFIEELCRTGSVKAAAHSVGMTPASAYSLRRHPQGEEFRKAWKDALAMGIQRLEDIAMERALHGVEVPVYHAGEIIGTRRAYNDALLMFMLRNRSPKRFAADALNGGGAEPKQLKKLKEQWRKEWEEEKRAQSSKNSAEVIESINRKLETMRQRRRAMMSPRTRRLEKLLQKSAELDQQRGRQYPQPEGDED